MSKIKGVCVGGGVPVDPPSCVHVRVTVFFFVAPGDSHRPTVQACSYLLFLTVWPI